MAKKANETVNKSTEKKPNFFVRNWTKIKGWCHEMKVELKKVHWASRSELFKALGGVLVCILIVGVCVWVFDGLASAIIKALLNLCGG